MSEKKNREKRKSNLLTYDTTVENPEDIIAKDDERRKQVFREANKAIAKIIPEYFMTQKKKKNSSGGTTFTQNIVVTSEKATVQTKEATEGAKGENQKEEKERE